MIVNQGCIVLEQKFPCVITKAPSYQTKKGLYILMWMKGRGALSPPPSSVDGNWFRLRSFILGRGKIDLIDSLTIPQNTSFHVYTSNFVMMNPQTPTPSPKRKSGFSTTPGPHHLLYKDNPSFASSPSVKVHYHH